MSKKFLINSSLLSTIELGAWYDPGVKIYYRKVPVSSSEQENDLMNAQPFMLETESHPLHSGLHKTSQQCPPFRVGSRKASVRIL